MPSWGPLPPHAPPPKGEDFYNKFHVVAGINVHANFPL